MLIARNSNCTKVDEKVCHYYKCAFANVDKSVERCPAEGTAFCGKIRGEEEKGSDDSDSGDGYFDGQIEGRLKRRRFMCHVSHFGKSFAKIKK